MEQRKEDGFHYLDCFDISPVDHFKLDSTMTAKYHSYGSVKITRIIDEEVIDYGPEIKATCRNEAHWVAKFTGIDDYDIVRLIPASMRGPDPQIMIPSIDN